MLNGIIYGLTNITQECNICGEEKIQTVPGKVLTKEWKQT